MFLTVNPRTTHMQEFFAEIKRKSDNAANFFLAGFFAIGLGLAFFYDTWLVAVGVGGLSLLAYYSAKIALPDSKLYQYVLSAVLGIFMAQYIYQMHGLFEMHFIAFIASAMLITYQNWKLQIPLALLVIVHHATFAYLQYIGYDKIYFTQLDYMTLQTFIIHGFLATVVFFICGLWAWQFKKYSEVQISQSFEIGKLEEEKAQKDALVAMSNEVKESNRKLNEAQHIARLGSWSWDVKNDISTRSDEMYRIMDRDPGMLSPGKAGFIECLHPEDREYVQAQINKCLDDHQPFSYEARLITPDGREKIIHAQAAVMENNNKELVELHGTVQDVTERKKVEAEIQALNETLEKKVQERTAQLETANKELESFSYSVSHDLRAPLRVIDGFSKMIFKTDGPKLSESAKECMDVIMKNAKQMGQLIDDLLDFSRLGKATLSKNPVNMHNMVKAVVAELAPGNDNQHAEIVVHELAEVQCDPVLMKQVWVNLVSNAMKYSRKSPKPFIEIGVTKSSGCHTYYVKDNGVGFDMAHSNKLFSVFQRLHKVTEYEGTGVGLALVKRIIHKHGGDVWADAKLNGGATFYFKVPSGEK